jgi:lipoprotein signal peptidase
MWPIFNVADAALLVGVMLLVASGIFERRAAARHTVEA